MLISTITHCCSLGPSCHGAEFLRARGHTSFALPFDWIHSTPEMVSACLEDRCATLLNRRELHSVDAGPDVSGSAPTPRRERHGGHLRYRTKEHAHIFRHHDPAVHDGDFARLHSAADRLRRLLDDADAQVLYLHLQTDAAPGEESRDAFVRGARAMFASLCAGSSNRFALVLWCACKCSLRRPTFPHRCAGSSNRFALVAIRAIPRHVAAGHAGEAGEAGEAGDEAFGARELCLEEASDTRSLLVCMHVLTTAPSPLPTAGGGGLRHAQPPGDRAANALVCMQVLTTAPSPLPTGDRAANAHADGRPFFPPRSAGDGH